MITLIDMHGIKITMPTDGVNTFRHASTNEGQEFGVVVESLQRPDSFALLHGDLILGKEMKGMNFQRKNHYLCKSDKLRVRIWYRENMETLKTQKEGRGVCRANIMVLMDTTIFMSSYTGKIRNDMMSVTNIQ